MLSCQDFKKSWIETEGRISPEAREHLGKCRACRELVEKEKLLGSALEMIDDLPADSADIRNLMSEIHQRSRRRRIYSVIPSFFSLLIFSGGIIRWGGVPAQGLIRDLPARSFDAFGDILEALMHSARVVGKTAKGASEVLPGTVGVSAGMLSLVGVAATMILYRRWKQRWISHT